jgi:SOS-response transcriptional repressor LexA
MKLGEKVKKLRLERDLSIAELARAANIPLKSLAAIESRGSIKSEFAPQIAQALEVPVDDILSDPGEPHIGHLSDSILGLREARFKDPKFAGAKLFAQMVPVISWVRAGSFDDANDPFMPGEADDWVPSLRRGGDNCYALRVRGDSMYDPKGPKSFPEGSIIIVDPDKRSPVSGTLIIAKVAGAHDATFKRYRNEDGQQWLQPLNEAYRRIDSEFDVLGTVIGKWEDA